MFISTKEKQRIDELLDRARGQILTLEGRISILEHKLEKLESKTVKVKKPKKPLTAAQKAKQRAYQRAYNERKKAKQLAIQILQGTTNVSA